MAWVPGSRSKFGNWTSVPSLYSWNIAECDVKPQSTHTTQIFVQWQNTRMTRRVLRSDPSKKHWFLVCVIALMVSFVFSMQCTISLGPSEKSHKQYAIREELTTIITAQSDVYPGLWLSLKRKKKRIIYSKSMKTQYLYFRYLSNMDFSIKNLFSSNNSIIHILSKDSSLYWLVLNVHFLKVLIRKQYIWVAVMSRMSDLYFASCSLSWLTW